MANKSAIELLKLNYFTFLFSLLPIMDVDFMDELLKHGLLPGGVKSKLESLTGHYHERSLLIKFFLDNVPALTIAYNLGTFSGS